MLVFLTIITNDLFAQERITEKFNNIPLSAALDLITKKYGVKIAFDNAVVEGVFVSANIKKDLPGQAIEKLLSNTGLDVVKINDVFILKKKALIEPVAEKPKNVVGIVRDKISGETLPYANVKVLGANIGTSTNPDGFFSIQESAEDSMTIRVSYIGFEPLEMKVAKLEFNSSPVIVELDRNSITLPDVKVVKEMSEFISVGSRPSEFVWNSRKVGQVSSLSGIDIVAPLQLLPGVDGTVESLSGLTVRHSPSDKNLFIYDGFTIYHIDHFFGAFTSFNSKAIKDIRLIRGGFDSRWGGRASSVVEVTGKTGNENSFVVDAGGDQLSADIAMEGPIGKKTTFVLAARRSFTDYYRSDLYYNLFESASSDLLSSKLNVGAFNTDPSLPEFYYYDINAKINFKPTQKDNISISGYRGTDDLNYKQLETNPYIEEDSYWGNQGVGVRWARQWSPNFYHNLTIGASDYNLFYYHNDSTLRKRQYSTLRDTILKDYKIDNGLSDISINLSGHLKLGQYNTLEGGFHGNMVDIDSYESYVQATNGSKAIDTVRTTNFYSETFTGWIQNTISIDNLKAFTFGFRASHHNLTSNFYFEPRFQLMINPSEKLTLKFAAGQYNQYVNRVLQFGSSYKNIWTASDGDRFPVVKSKHFIAGFSWKGGNGLILDLEGYAKKTDGISYLQSSVRRTSGNKVTMVSKLYTVDTRAFGVDILVKKSWSDAEFWIAYSLSKTFNQSDNLNGGDEYSSLDDHLHELKLVGVYSVGRWRFTANWIYGSPKPWDELTLSSTLQISPDYEKNSSRLVPYHRLDAGITYTQKILQSELQIGVKGFNIYNRNNLLSKPYSLSDTPIQDYLQGDPVIVFTDYYGLGFTPTLFFNLKF
ncbi:MAG TPA: carboxypeptidase-like regulatory domain-containing protein [Tenuifilaceae bacterium]|nr:carboxypeptidase-like regulatory domain-containing protein [Tenuifilaceae bacterium]HPN21388.1 carboxypeptidase-like regulatory domain-containing protein [Tenuifilaceae bacterium]